MASIPGTCPASSECSRWTRRRHPRHWERLLSFCTLHPSRRLLHNRSHTYHTVTPRVQNLVCAQHKPGFLCSSGSTKQPSLERPLLPTTRPVERLLLRTRNLSGRRRLGNLGIGGNLCSPVAPHAVFEFLRTSLCHRCPARSVIHRSSAEPTNLPQLPIIRLRISDATQWESDGNHRTRAHCKVLPPFIAQGWPSQLFSQAHPLV
jgi:hypothetical protein